jgi:hypothetical protein
MPQRIFPCLIMICILILTTSATAQIAVHSRNDARIDFDGVPNESAWEQAEVIDDFTQFELVSGAQPTERTEVRLLHDNANLYIGITCYDSDPSGIIAKQMKQDQDPSSDDRITFIISTYNDKRTGYLFTTNPNGYRYDASFPGSLKRDSNPSWDGIWDSRARTTNYGWTAEIIIPFKTLRFPATDSQTWGFNVMRTIRRKSEQVMWRSWGRDDGLWQLSKMGTINIDRSVERGRQLDVKPYILTGAAKQHGEKLEDEFKYGVDLRYGISSNTQVHLTTKTDFAQIESDREIINLTRFSLNYPEKRDFFLENSDLYDFAQGMNTIFYSRRIGISKTNRTSIPILGGAKFSHTAGKLRLGVMSMQTEEADGMASTNYSVVRLKRDIWEQSHVGLVTTSISDADGHTNQVYGGDFVFRTDKFMGNRNFEITSYLVGSLTDGHGYNSIAGRIYFHYPSDVFDAFWLYHALGKGYNPEMGYISREPGIQQYMAVFSYTPRPGFAHIKKLDFRPLYFNYYTDTRQKLISRYISTQPIGFITDNDDTFSFTLENKYEYLVTPFNIHEDVIIPTGAYDWWQYEFELATSDSRTVFATLSSEFGGFYDGSRSMAQANIAWKRSKHYAIAADARYNDVNIGGRDFITREYGGELVMDVTTRLNGNALIQWNNETKEVNLNVRIHFIPKIGSDIFLVYNHLWDEKEDLLRGDRADYYTVRNIGLFKVDYNYRF